MPYAVEVRLKNLVAKTGRTKSYYITEATCEHLDDLEDLYLAEQRLRDIRAGKIHTISICSSLICLDTSIGGKSTVR